MSQTPSVGSRRPGRFWIILILVLGFGAMGIALVSAAVRKPSEEFTHVNGISDQQRIFGGVRQDLDRLGEPDAPVQIQVFTDVQCEECKDEFNATVPALVDQEVREGDVALLFRNRSLAENATEIGFYGVEAAAKQGYGWQYAYLLFQNQDEAKVKRLDKDFLTKIAESITHLDVVQWTKDFDEGIPKDSEMTRSLEDTDKLSFDLKIRAHPAFVVTGPNGTEIVQDSPSLDEVQQAIDSVR